jgi:hypothetical protein
MAREEIVAALELRPRYDTPLSALGVARNSSLRMKSSPNSSS